MKQLFDYQSSVNAILYLLKELGGCSDMHKLCKMLYFADQGHLSKYGRSITGDVYIAMRFGPVPSKIDDILKAVRGDSFFSDCIDLADKLHFDNRYIIRGLAAPDMDELSESDVECLDAAVKTCGHLNFDELTSLSHGLAWSNTARDRAISVKDIMREVGDDEDYVEYVASQIKLQSIFC